MTADRRNVVLTGFMGTGKTTVGRALAERLGAEFVDTDDIIESRHGPIPDIFAEHGEEHFRELEREVARELSTRRDLVISTGGRMMVDDVNAAVLGATSDVVCLTAKVDTILERVSEEIATRPMLQGDDPRARITELLDERAAAYAEFTQVATDDRSVDDIVDEMLTTIGV